MFVSDKFLLRKDQEVILMFQGNFILNNQSDTIAHIQYSDDDSNWQSFIELAPNTQIKKTIEHRYIRLISDNEVYCLLQDTSNDVNIDLSELSPLQQELVTLLQAQRSDSHQNTQRETVEFVKSLPNSVSSHIAGIPTLSGEGDLMMSMFVSNPFNELWDITKVITFRYKELVLPTEIHTYTGTIMIDIFFKGTLLGSVPFQVEHSL